MVLATLVLGFGSAFYIVFSDLSPGVDADAADMVGTYFGTPLKVR